MDRGTRLKKAVLFVAAALLCLFVLWQFILLFLSTRHAKPIPPEQPKNELGLTDRQMQIIESSVVNGYLSDSAKEQARKDQEAELMRIYGSSVSTLFPEPAYSIGKAIPDFMYTTNGLQATDESYYPIFYSGELVTVCHLDSDVSNPLCALWQPGMSLALVHDAAGIHVWDGATLTLLYRYLRDDPNLLPLPEDYAALLSGIALSTIDALTLPLENVN